MPDSRADLLPTPGDTVLNGSYVALPDPVSDRLLSILLALATEVWTTRDRLRLLEKALVERGVEVESLIVGTDQSEDELATMRTDRDAFIERLMKPLTSPRRP